MIVFDLDGTLVDSAGEIYAAMEHAWATLERAPFQRDRVKIGPPLAEIMRALGAADPEAVAAAFRTRYDASDFSATKPFAGIPEALAELAPRGRLAVATNKRFAPTNKILGRWFPERFERVACTDVVDGLAGTYAKSEMLQRLGATVLVGDTVGDVRAARDAGVRVVAVTWGYDAEEALEKAAPDDLVRAPSELARALR